MEFKFKIKIELPRDKSFSRNMRENIDKYVYSLVFLIAKLKKLKTQKRKKIKIIIYRFRIFDIRWDCPIVFGDYGLDGKLNLKSFKIDVRFGRM